MKNYGEIFENRAEINEKQATLIKNQLLESWMNEILTVKNGKNEINFNVYYVSFCVFFSSHPSICYFGKYFRAKMCLFIVNTFIYVSFVADFYLSFKEKHTEQNYIERKWLE